MVLFVHFVSYKMCSAPESKREYVCSYDDCLKSYTTLSHLKRHFSTHEARRRCPEEGCDRTFKSDHYLKKHLDVVHHKRKHKRFKCSYCDQEFNKRNWLQSHLYSHTGLKPHVCQVEGCEKRFLYPKEVRRHMKIHTGYTCDKPNCNKTFALWSQLRSHVKAVHPKIFRCHFCEKLFKTSSNLKSHLIIHQFLDEREVYHCPKPKCDRFYSTKSNLSEHLKSYHDARPYVCTVPTCSRAFKAESDLTKHSSHHNPVRQNLKKKKDRPSFAAKLSGYAKRKAKREMEVAEEKEMSLSDKDEIVCIKDEIEVIEESTTPQEKMPEIMVNEMLDVESTNLDSSKVTEIDPSLQTLLGFVQEVQKEPTLLVIQ